jgi:hypothetical protein
LWGFLIRGWQGSSPPSSAAPRGFFGILQQAQWSGGRLVAPLPRALVYVDRQHDIVIVFLFGSSSPVTILTKVCASPREEPRSHLVGARTRRLPQATEWSNNHQL